MKITISRLIATTLAIASLQASTASELQQYVQQCQTELHFAVSDVKPMNCNDGAQFANGAFSLINDFLLYQKVNENVDLVAACRWGDDDIPVFNNTKFASLELIIHNRQNGETCFFAANDSATGFAYTGDPLKPVASAVVSPTNFNFNHSKTNPNADDYWLSPTTLNNQTLISDRITINTKPSATDPVQCVGCHSQGPYIASADIAPFLAQYGLLNNRHDTYANMSSTSFHYHVVGSSSGPPYNNLPAIPAFQNWDTLIAGNNNGGCSSACHALASGSTIGNLYVPSNLISRLLPSIQSDIGYLTNNGMAPYDDASDYRWINLHTPTEGIEAENLVDALSATNTLVPHLFNDYSTCSQPNVPGNLEAHAVGVDIRFGFSTAAMSQLPDRLRTFNLKDGLICINTDQEPGHQCSNYRTRYLCSANTGPITATWSDWYNTDSPTEGGDHEERSKDQNICGGVSPIAIQAEVSVNGNPISVMGPNDRLARFSPYGLTCNNTDQSDMKCSNYVVRYSGCAPPPLTFSRTLTSANVPSSGSKQLTAAAGSSVKGQVHNNAWDTQLWVIAPIANTEYVRLKNTSNKINVVYLSVTSTMEQVAVGTAAFNSTATGEMWSIEPISGSSHVRLKNLLSGKYLTMADPNSYPNSPDYLPIFSQALNTSWNTQRWILQ